MGFRLVLKLVTWNDLEQCNGHYFAFGATYVKAIEDRPIQSATVI